MNRITSMFIVASIGLGLSVGCEMFERNDNKSGTRSAQAQRTAVARVGPSQAATTRPVNNNVTGTVTFTQNQDGQVKVVADLSGLSPNSEHAFHLHDKGDLSAPDLPSAGPHFNPAGTKHGGLHAEHRHAGDLGNIKADADGKAHAEITLEDISLGGENSIIGKSIIVHAKADDLKTDPSGNSGDRIAGGIIEMEAGVQ